VFGESTKASIGVGAIPWIACLRPPRKPGAVEVTPNAGHPPRASARRLYALVGPNCGQILA